MPLTDPACRNAKSKDKQYKLSDAKGLYLLVNNSGKYFRFDYRFTGKRKTLALGVYPNVSLKEARIKRDDAKKMIENGVDPSHFKKMSKAMRLNSAGNSFESVAREWIAKRSPGWADSHVNKIIRRLELYVFPWLGSRPISEITPPELLTILRRVESKGIIDTAHRVHQNCGQIFRYAVATGRAERDQAADLRGALTSSTSRRMAAITDPKQVGGLLKAIDGYSGHFVTKFALRLSVV